MIVRSVPPVFVYDDAHVSNSLQPPIRAAVLRKIEKVAPFWSKSVTVPIAPSFTQTVWITARCLLEEQRPTAESAVTVCEESQMLLVIPKAVAEAIPISPPIQSHFFMSFTAFNLFKELIRRLLLLFVLFFPVHLRQRPLKLSDRQIKSF